MGNDIRVPVGEENRIGCFWLDWSRVEEKMKGSGEKGKEDVIKGRNEGGIARIK